MKYLQNDGYQISFLLYNLVAGKHTMKLNADIIYHELKKKYKAEISGPKKEELVLGRPEFYMEDERTFLADHLYLATADHLPQRSGIQEGAVLVCIGEHINLKNYRNRLCLIVIRNKADFFKVYQYLQKIFDYYEEWEQKLYQDLFNDAGIHQMLADSGPVFQNPVNLLDQSFRFIAADAEQEKTISENGSLDPQAIDTFLSSYDLMTEKKGAIFIDSADHKVLCVNLFNRNNEYEGCLYIEQESRDTGREAPLAEYLASMLELAIARNPSVINDEQSSLKRVMQTLVEEMPLSHAQRLVLNAMNRKNTYVCVMLEYRHGQSPLPASYICDSFEEVFAGSFAFRNDQAITGFIAVAPLMDPKRKDYKANLNHNLNDFISRMRMNVGISNEFDDLFDIRIHYMQARSALENGRIMSPSGHLFYFASYALTEMIINSLGGLPAEAYFPTGLKKIFEHDRSSGVSYLETLKVFLEENLSYTAAAQRLYIHRSTLIDRISRIERELKIDLGDADQRLQLEMLLKAVDIEEILRMQ